MRRLHSPRPVPPHAGNRVPAHGPGTPQRSGDKLAELIRSLESEFHLGLHVRDSTWSPNKRADSLADKVQGQIKRLYFSSEPTLRETLLEFRTRADGLPQPQEKLEYLQLLLRSRTSSPFTTRATRSVTPANDTQKSLRDQASGPVPKAPREFHILRNDTPEPLHTTAQNPGSPTDDERDWSAPPSPSASIKSTARRSQASPHVSSRGRKRPSESSDDQGSPKLTRTAKGKQSYENQPPVSHMRVKQVEETSLFKKPSREMAPSYQATSAQTSFKTSFNGSTGWSSQETYTQPDTAATSFNSNFADFPPNSQKTTRTSSTTMGSLDDEDLIEVGRILEVEQSRHSDATTIASSATYGSIDEDAMLLVSSGETLVNEPRNRWRNIPPEVIIAESATSHLRLQPERPVIKTSHDSPSRLGLQPEQPAIKTSHESPSRTGMSHHIRNIPRQNLFVDDIPESLKTYPYFILFICLRIATRCEISLEELMNGMDEDLVGTDHEAFWAMIESHPKITASLGGRESKKVWAAVQNERKLDGYNFKGSISFDSAQTKPVFRIELLPLEQDKSCRFQRAFGSDRFLYLRFPSLEAAKSDRFNKPEMGKIHDKFLEWFQMEHSFLGRKWRAFHLEPVKRGKGSKKDAEKYAIRVVLFATEGLGINTPCSLGAMVDWFFPFAAGDNLNQNFCKAFARLDLGLSRTVPTYVFLPSQVHYVQDMKADGTPEDTRYNDPNLHWMSVEDDPVMNDGCSEMSLGAAEAIWRANKKITGTNEPMPTSFQGRIGGAKGLWFVSSKSTNSGGPPPIWIKISKSQLKFEPHPEDFFDQSYDPLRLTFDLVNYSTSPAPSDLHLSFIPIMVDRGVPKETIKKIMVNQLDLDRAELLEMLEDPAQMYNWVHKKSAATQDPEDMPWQAALPLVLGDRIKMLLETGFRPTEEPYLAKSLSRLIQREHLFEEQKLRVPLAKSAFLYGIADPLGVLKPGEIHVQFSSWFYDEASDTRYLCLDDMDVLVARQPACRRSDLQKVRAISHPKLGHQLDVVVFPTKGQYPLAGKLQGGDYDGDIFWLCWESELVSPFRNAPAPTAELDPSQYGIRKVTRKLHDLVDPKDLSTVGGFLKEAVAFRIAPSLLGKVTNYLENQSYAENRIYSPTLDALSDMHDLLVDAPKQGYGFTDKEFDAVKRKLGLPAAPKDPAYKAAMELCAKAKEMGEADKLRSKNWKFNPDNTIDYLYFCVVREHHVETQRLVEEVLSKATSDDPVLQYPYLHEREKRDIAIEHEMKRLLKGFEPIQAEWNAGIMKTGGSSEADQYNLTVDKCYAMFQALVPEHVDLPQIKAWVEPYLSQGYTKWATLRASALYTRYPAKAAFVFHMAGKELADLKCPPSRYSRAVCGPIFSILKPKLTKARGRLEEVDEDDEDEFGTPLEEFP